MRCKVIYWTPLSLLCSDLQTVCGFSCEDIAGMFKELKGLGVVVKQLSHELRKVVSSEGRQGLLFVIIHSPLFLSSPSSPQLFPVRSHLSL